MHVREQDHARKYDASLVNISGGGGLIRTCAQFDYTSVVEVTLSLPGESMLVVQAQVIHVDDAPTTGIRRRATTGCDLSIWGRMSRQAITHYMWDRLRELYPPSWGE